MMKNRHWTLLLTLSGIACDLSPTPRSVEAVRPTDRADACGEASVELIAGQNIDVGGVTVYNDESTICVAFSTEGEWYLTDTHLAIATDPPLSQDSCRLHR
jgi:hypothetical protein